MGEKLTDFGEEMKELLTDFGEEMKELIKKGMEEAFEKAREAVRKSLAEWVMESRTTKAKKMGTELEAKEVSKLAAENDEGGREIEVGGEGPQAKEMSKLLPEMPALQVFDENSDRIIIQKAPKSIAPALDNTLPTGQTYYSIDTTTVDDCSKMISSVEYPNFDTNFGVHLNITSGSGGGHDAFVSSQGSNNDEMLVDVYAKKEEVGDVVKKSDNDRCVNGEGNETVLIFDPGGDGHQKGTIVSNGVASSDGAFSDSQISTKKVGLTARWGSTFWKDCHPMCPDFESGTESISSSGYRSEEGSEEESLGRRADRPELEYPERVGSGQAYVSVDEMLSDNYYEQEADAQPSASSQQRVRKNTAGFNSYPKPRPVAANKYQSRRSKDSTIHSSICDLSPVKPLKGATMAQSFPGRDYSPHGFTSPRISPQIQSKSLERSQYYDLSSEYSKKNGDKNDNVASVICTPGKLDTKLSYQVNSHDIGPSSNSSALGEGGIASKFADKYWEYLLKAICEDVGNVTNSRLKQFDTATLSSKDFAECINNSSMIGEQHNGCVRTEVSQQMPDVPTCCLQYDETQQNAVAKNCGSKSQSNAACISSSVASQLQVLESSSAPIYAPSNSVELENISKPTSSMFHAPKLGRSSLAVPKLSRFGLHLNSILNALPTGCGASASVKSAEENFMILQGQKSLCTTDSHSAENTGNCKKSMCLKRYCECYQSNVGCSDGCRCDRCQNVYGKKEEYDSRKHIAIPEATLDIPEISFDQKLDTLHMELRPHNFRRVRKDVVQLLVQVSAFDLEDKVALWERGIVMDWPNSVGLLNLKRNRPKISPKRIRVWRLKEGKEEELGYRKYCVIVCVAWERADLSKVSKPLYYFQ